MSDYSIFINKWFIRTNDPDAYFEIRHIKETMVKDKDGKEKKAKIVKSKYFNNPDEAIRWTDENKETLGNDEWNIYYGVNPRYKLTEAERSKYFGKQKDFSLEKYKELGGSKEYIKKIIARHSDLDQINKDDRTGASEENYRKAMEVSKTFVKILKEKNAEGFVISSGNGIQTFIFLQKPIYTGSDETVFKEQGQRNLTLAEKLLADAYQIDKDFPSELLTTDEGVITDIARVMRLPGTKNQKGKRMAYTIEELVPQQECEPFGAEGEKVDYDKSPYLEELLKTELKSPHGRYDIFLSIRDKMAWDGKNISELEQAMRAWNNRQKPEFRAPDDYINAALKHYDEWKDKKQAEKKEKYEKWKKENKAGGGGWGNAYFPSTPKDLSTTDDLAGGLGVILRSFGKERPVFPHLKDMDTVMSIYGEGYEPMKTAVYHSQIGALKPIGIRYRDIHTDLRLPFGLLLDSGFGKGNMMKYYETVFKHFPLIKIASPTSSHYEQFIGKTMERRSMGETVHLQNAGYVGYNLLVMDEKRRMIEKPTKDEIELLTLIYQALDSIPNSVSKKGVDILESEGLRYCATATPIIIAQPIKKMPFEILKEGYGRRIMHIYPDVKDNDEELDKILASRSGRALNVDNSPKTKKEAEDRIVKWLENVQRRKINAISADAITFIQYTSPILIRLARDYLKSKDFPKILRQTMPGYLLKFASIYALARDDDETSFDMKKDGDDRMIILDDVICGTFNFLTLYASWLRYMDEMVSGMRTESKEDMLILTYLDIMGKKGLDGKKMKRSEFLDVGVEVRQIVNKNKLYGGRKELSFKHDTIRREDMERLENLKIIKKEENNEISISLSHDTKIDDIVKKDYFVFLQKIKSLFEMRNGENYYLTPKAPLTTLIDADGLGGLPFPNSPPNAKDEPIEWLYPKPEPPFATKEEFESKFEEIRARKKRKKKE